jgi:tetratricopeptide (TPR) repeat protein
MNIVKASRESLVLPTYKTGKPEINPVFFEKRVYQGSSGKVYPLPFIDKVNDHREEVSYDSAILENEFVRLVMLPEIGGRIFEAQDKTNDNYNFFYQQKVIKPALVGLAGPWISGGLELNWPQHHRPGTFLPTDVFIEEESDGSRTVWMSEHDPMYRLKGMHGIRLRPDSALIELRGRLFNRTPLTQSFLWWANLAVRTHKDYRSFFPPDVHYVADHAVRAMSSFPLAENHYYGIPYHERPGRNDLRAYKNIPVPTSYMVCDTQFDFFGGYDFKAEGGFVHVANRHIAPGKKQWTWGNEEFGWAWDRELTDEGGPYLELMGGLYTDNQPDFSYLLPYETKTFSQYWWSYKKLGPVQNANKDFALKLQPSQDNKLELGVASSRVFNNLTISLKKGSELQSFEDVKVSPSDPWINHSIEIRSGEENSMVLTVSDKSGKVLLSYHHRELDLERKRKLAVEPRQPEDIQSANELELIGEHLELYRHPTRYPEPYWEEAIRKDPDSYKSHIALGRVKLKNGLFESSENHFKKAMAIMTKYHPNPASGEAHYFCGLALFFSGRPEEAYACFYKATWNYEWRAQSYYHLALIDSQQSAYETALEHLEASLDTNRQNNKAIILKSIILRHQSKPELAKRCLDELFEKDPLDQWANYERALHTGDFSGFLSSSRNDAQTLMDIAFDYAEAGFYGEAISLLELHHQEPVPESAVPNPMKTSTMTLFILAWLYEKTGESVKSEDILKSSQHASYDYLFPSRIYEQLVLEWVMQKPGFNSAAAYGLGNYYFNLKRHQEAITVWEQAAEKQCQYATLHRNLGIAFWNIGRNGAKARQAFKQAIAFSPDDIRIRYEYDQLRKKLYDNPEERLESLLKIKDRITERDDFSVELAALYISCKQAQNAIKTLEGRNFHPWEGGEGKVLKQYTDACLALGQEALQAGDAEKALGFFNKSLNTPDNLGEKYHPLQAVAHINYWKGMASKALGNKEEANKYFTASIREEGDFIDMSVSAFSELTFYKALSLQELGRKKEARQLLQQLKSFGEAKLKEEAQIDYFATSLPLLLVFEDDLQKRNQQEAKHLISLAEKGLQLK